jgi:hypothetical protein
VRGVPRTSG